VWRSICAVILLPSLAAAQADTTATSQRVSPQAPGSETQFQFSPSYRAYTYYAAIRQGTTEKAAVQLVLGEPGKVFASARSFGASAVPTKLELQGDEGLTVGRIKYPKPFKRQFAFQKDPIPVHVAAFAVQFTVTAAKDTRLGVHTLRGKITFQTINEAGVSAVQQMEVEIPVTVVEPGAKVMRDGWPYYNPNPEGARTYVLLALLAPIIIPLMIVALLVCGITGGSCAD